MRQPVALRSILASCVDPSESPPAPDSLDVKTGQPSIVHANELGRSNRATPVGSTNPSCGSLLCTHVGTDVFASAMLVEDKTVLKSHSLNGHYAGIRPVRLPNRKLAWPIAEIKKLFDGSTDTSVTKEAA